MHGDNIIKGIKGFLDLSDDDKLWLVDYIEKNLTVLEERAYLRKQLASILRNVVNRPYVFLSHSSKDKRFVRNLAAKLEQARIRVWLDEAELKIGQSLIERLREAIDSVDFLIVVLSKSSITSSWVQKEIEIAMNQEIKNRRIKVLPILKEYVELPGFLEGKLYIDFSHQSMRFKSTQKLIEHILTYERWLARSRLEESLSKMVTAGKKRGRKLH